MFCGNCGAQLPDNLKFCPKCGAAVVSVPEGPAAPAPEPARQYCGNGEVREGIPAPGYSDRVNHPELLAAVKKNRKASGVFGFFLIPLPLIGFVLYSRITGDMEMRQALLIGGIVSGIFLLITLLSAASHKASKAYEGTVTYKDSRLVTRYSGSDRSNRQSYTEFTTRVKTTSGETKRIVEKEGSNVWAYQYLSIGDRFRYLPQFNFPYELYDKSKAPHLYCVNCCTKNPLENDRCKKCHLPLLK